MGKLSRSARAGMSRLLWQGPIVLVLLAALAFLLLDVAKPGGGADITTPALTVAPTTQPLALPLGLTPEPWYYDAANNQHWHPDHAHWHSGPPPPPSQRLATTQPASPTTQPATLPSGLTPEPWFYDAVNNQHWHPGHGHWHPGPTPPPGQRQ